MPIRKVKKDGKTAWQWGTSGKVYPTKKQAEEQRRAIYASGWREKSGSKKKK